MRYSFDLAAAEGESPYFGVMDIPVIRTRVIPSTLPQYGAPTW
jgi:hypothetical protein